MWVDYSGGGEAKGMLPPSPLKLLGRGTCPLLLRLCNYHDPYRNWSISEAAKAMTILPVNRNSDPDIEPCTTSLDVYILSNYVMVH